LIVVLTSRPREQHAEIFMELLRHGFPIEHVTNVKPPAEAYLDDKAVRIPKNWR
jgi:hypothetical protein